MVWVGRVSDGSRVGCRMVVVSVRVSLGGMPRHDRQQCQAEPEGGSRGLIYIEIGTEIIEGLRG